MTANASVNARMSSHSLFLAHKITAPARPHARGVHRARGNIAALPGAIFFRLAIHRERHFALQDDVRRQPPMRMIGIERFWPILPDECVDEAFVLKLLPKQALVPWSHFPDYTKRRAHFRRLSRGDAGKKEKGKKCLRAERGVESRPQA